ncbi:MAG: histidine kinase [Tidjanibacter sp.]|nr:histidine kinase [Tidjanibacter sp.]
MLKRGKYRKIVANALIAFLLTVLVNFSYLVFLMMSRTEAPQASEPTPPRTEQVATEVAQDEVATDESTAEVAPQEEVAAIDTDSLKGSIIIREESLKKMSRHRSHEQMNRQAWSSFMVIDLLYIFVVAMVMLSIMTETRRGRYFGRLLLCALLLVVFFLVAPQMTWRGNIITTLHSGRIFFNPMSILKLAATFVVAILYGKIYELLYKKQEMEVENEKLKNESLSWQYNTLVNQVNPHFLFNSLNSLSMLVREGQTEAAQTYIDRMSETYRYIISEGNGEMTSVAEELKFVEAYRYLLEVRYAGKLHIEIEVEPKYTGYKIPALSIQPLIENAVKHNTITSAQPMHITISATDDYIVVSNPIAPKIEPEKSTGIGLRNLANRYALISNRQMIVEQTGGNFVVKLPIQQPK